MAIAVLALMTATPAFAGSTAVTAGADDRAVGEAAIYEAGLTLASFSSFAAVLDDLQEIADDLVAATQARGGVFRVNTTNDTVDAAIGDGRCRDANGRCSLRAAVQEANARGGGSIVLQRNATYVLTIAGAGEDNAATGDLDILGDISISGRGSVVDANGLDRAFDVVLGAALSVDRLVVTGGFVTDANGGAYRSDGSLTIASSGIFGNTAEGEGASGGAIANNLGSLDVSATEISGNTASRAGGGIEAVGGSTDLDQVELDGNSTGDAPGNGGGLHLTGEGDVTVSDSVVTSNFAAAEGGGLWNSAVGTMTVTNTVVAGNTADGNDSDQGGGGLFNDGGTLVVSGGSVDANQATGTSGSGGGLLNNLGTLEVSGTVISGNDASRAGGGIEANAGSTDLDQVELDGNSTGDNPGNGGGLHLTGAGDVTVTNSSVTNNFAAAEGGGLWNSAVGTMTVTNTLVSYNTAAGNDSDQGGGGLFSDGGTLVVIGGLIEGNQATGTSGSGGGLLNNLGSLRIDRTVVRGNDAIRAGGGIEANAGSTDLFRVELDANTTGDNPGNGGGLHLTGAGVVTIRNSNVTNNIAANEGGGLWNSATGTMTVVNTVIAGNQAPVGPNVFNDGGTFTIDGVPVPPGP